MRYELDNNGYVNKVFFGCMSGNCKEYRGSIPDGYGKNLFDILGSYTKTTGVSTYWTMTENSLQVEPTSGNSGYMYYDKKYKNEFNYVLSYVNASGRCRPLLKLFDGDGNNLSNVTVSGWTYNEGAYKGYFIDVNATNVSIPFVLPNTVAYFQLGFVAMGYTITNVQLEISTTATDYEPYGGVVDGKNLFNIKNIPLAVVLVDDTSFKCQGLSGTLFDYDFKANTQYTISCIIKHNTAGYGQYIRVYYTDGTYTSLTTDKTENTYLKITTPSDKTVSNLTLKYSTYAIVTTISELQIEEGSTATSYEPYGSVPADEESYNTALVNWATNETIQAYYLVDGNLTYDANKDAEIKTLLDLQNKKILWQGGSLMKGSQTANLNGLVTSQLNGIVLVWSHYQNDTVKDEGFTFFFVPKSFISITNDAGYGVNCPIAHNAFGVVANKYVYIHDDRIVGNDINSSTGTSNGITYANNRMVLRYVLGV